MLAHPDLKVSKDLLANPVNLDPQDPLVSWDQLVFPEKTEVMEMMVNQDDLDQGVKKAHKVQEVSLEPQELLVSRDIEDIPVPTEKREILVPQEKMVNKVTLENLAQPVFKDHVVYLAIAVDQEHPDPQVLVDLMEHLDKLDLPDLLETADHQDSLVHLVPRVKPAQLAQEALKAHKVPVVNQVLQDPLAHLV